MKIIPIQLKQRLSDVFKSYAMNNDPRLRVVAKQLSKNTLLSEVIHEEKIPDFGDVTVRQTAIEPEPKLAYAACIDNGLVKIYKRRLPADYNFNWEKEWEYTNASEVAIEYNGTWKQHPTKSYCYLETDAYPWIFTVEDGSLYVQHWQDESTRIRLAKNVTQISACRGWQNEIDKTRDFGLIIGYLRENGKVYYRSRVYLSEGHTAWEEETEVTDLGSDNVSLQVIRTNDYRMGFLTEKESGEIKLALSEREVSGMGIHPETVVFTTSASFSFVPFEYPHGYAEETVRYKNILPYFLEEPVDHDGALEILSYEKINGTTQRYYRGVILHLSAELEGHVPRNYEDTITVLSDGVPVEIDHMEINGATITLYFEEDIDRLLDADIELPATVFISYKRFQEQKWYFEELELHIPEQEGIEYTAVENESVTYQVQNAEFEVYEITDNFGYGVENVSFGTSTTFTVTYTTPIPV